MSTLFDLLATLLVSSFMICCAASALLQARAWTRHALEGRPVTLRALREPDGYFDPVGVRQIRLARRLLTVGGVAYLTYGLMIVVSAVV